jgi:hypothetical protein
MCRQGSSCDIGWMQIDNGKQNRAQQAAPLLSRRLGETRGGLCLRQAGLPPAKMAIASCGGNRARG